LFDINQERRLTFIDLPGDQCLLLYSTAQN